MKLKATIAMVLGCAGLTSGAIPAVAQDFPAACTNTNPCVGSDWYSATSGTQSTTTYMASHRFQRHSVVTKDGAFHIIVDTGSQNGNALQLYSNANPLNGGSWYLSHTFLNTETYQNTTNKTVSTDDVSLRQDPAGTEYMDVVFDTEANGTNALMFTEMVYDTTQSPPAWTERKNYPQVIATSSGSNGAVFQQPSLAWDSNNDLWVADLQLTFNSAGVPQAGGVYLYERVQGSWNPISVSITGNTTSSTPSADLINSLGSNVFAHAPRLVYVPAASGSTLGNIGLLFQDSTCLYWTTISGNASLGFTATNSLELSQYSNSPASSTCNLVSQQSTFPDTAFSVATNPTTGDQYLGFVTNYPSGSSGGTAVYAMSYKGSSAGGAWNTNGSLLNYNGSIYVKSVFGVIGTNSYSYMIINNGQSIGTPETLDFFVSPALSASVVNTSYTSPKYILKTSSGNAGNFSNPRIDAPQYVNTNSTSMSPTLFVPVWLQYAVGTTRSPSG